MSERLKIILTCSEPICEIPAAVLWTWLKDGPNKNFLRKYLPRGLKRVVEEGVFRVFSEYNLFYFYEQKISFDKLYQQRIFEKLVKEDLISWKLKERSLEKFSTKKWKILRNRWKSLFKSAKKDRNLEEKLKELVTSTFKETVKEVYAKREKFFAKKFRNFIIIDLHAGISTEECFKLYYIYTNYKFQEIRDIFKKTVEAYKHLLGEEKLKYFFNKLSPPPYYSVSIELFFFSGKLKKKSWFFPRPLVSREGEGYEILPYTLEIDLSGPNKQLLCIYYLILHDFFEICLRKFQ